MVLEDFIGQFFYGSKGDDNKNSGDVLVVVSGNNEIIEFVGIMK